MNWGQKYIARKKRVLRYAEACGIVNKACRHFVVTRSNFYLWRNAFRRNGEIGLISRRSIARSHPQAQWRQQVASRHQGGSPLACRLHAHAPSVISAAGHSLAISTLRLLQGFELQQIGRGL